MGYECEMCAELIRETYHIKYWTVCRKCISKVIEKYQGEKIEIEDRYGNDVTRHFVEEKDE